MLMTTLKPSMTLWEDLAQHQQQNQLIMNHSKILLSTTLAVHQNNTFSFVTEENALTYSQEKASL